MGGKKSGFGMNVPDFSGSLENIFRVKMPIL
jgi:hypothetical protein